MKNMRQLISLMEGIQAVPGLNTELDEADLMEIMTDYDEHFIGSAIRDMYPTAASREELMSMVAGHTGYGDNPDFERVFNQQLDKILGNTDSGDTDDYTDYSMRQGEMGNPDRMSDDGMDDDEFGDEFDEDLQNGYNDVDVATGEDFFPNGADSPVVTNVGPSGARQGDNPEQKKMQVAEVHKELVLGYRNFLKESRK